MKKLLKVYKQKGFTLIELLIVIIIIATLAVTVFVALDPAKRIKDAKDARRTSDVQTILTAIQQSIVDNKGDAPSNMPAADGTIRGLGTGAACDLTTTDCGITLTGCIDLMTTAGAPRNLTTYLKSMPIDPTGGTTYTAAEVGYGVTRNANGIVTITACAREGGAAISASR